MLVAGKQRKTHTNNTDRVRDCTVMGWVRTFWSSADRRFAMSKERSIFAIALSMLWIRTAAH